MNRNFVMNINPQIKNMKHLSHFLIFIGLFWISAGYGQTDDPQDDPYIKQQINKIILPSPNAASLGIYGNVPVGHYTGIPNISIPIYEITTGDLTLPISLSYHASGIKVAQEASTVGLGWILNAGGCIVREIKHLDDFGYEGYYSDSSVPTCDENNDVADPRDSRYFRYLNNEKDSEPDMFSYNFGNVSGHFFFDRKNGTTNTAKKAEAIISNKDTWLKITCIRPENHSPLELSFEIMDAYGNTYLFGSRENTRSFQCALREPPQQKYLNRYYQDFEPRDGNSYEITTAWYLDKIITPKRDTISFEYEKERILSSVGVSEDASFMILMYGSGNGSTPLPKTSYRYYCLSYTSNDQLLLKKISFNGGEINIDYGDREDIVFDDFGKKAKKADWLTIKNKSNNYVSRVRFNHSYLENRVEDLSLGAAEQKALNSRLLLDGITIYRNSGSPDQNYKFTYNTEPLPCKNSRHTDYWGYYNEGPEPLWNQSFHFAPSFEISYTDSKGYRQTKNYKGINKNPNIDRCQHGILTSIRYPTGGRTDFEYEINDFSNNFLDSADSVVKIGGGLRIQKIYDLSDTSDTTSVRTFEYKKNGKSSGILMTAPVYHLLFNLSEMLVGAGSYSGEYVNGTSNSYSPIMGSASGMYVGYSYVEERNTTHGVNNGYVAHSFYNNANRKVDLGENVIRNFPSIPYMDNGLPIYTTFFDSDNNRVKTTNYQYSQVELSSIKGFMCYLPPMAISPIFVKFYDLYSERWVLNSKTDTQYFPGDKSISVRTAYVYNKTNWLKEAEHITSVNGCSEDTFGTHFRYPSDYGSVFSGMVAKNMIGIPVEITRTKNGNIISGNKTSFGNFNNGMYLPQTYSELDTSSETYHTQFTIDRYDTRGNILQITDKNNVPTSYLWSYNGKYPVAEIKNATFDQVYDALGVSAFSTITNYSGGSIAVPDFKSHGATLRSKLPHAFVTIYTYKPLVGGTGITDPSGRTTRYEYDAFNRLSEIRNDRGVKGDLMQKFEYKYHN